MAAGLSNFRQERWVASDDRAPLGRGHVLVAIKAEGRSFAVCAHFLQSGSMGGVFYQQQASAAGKGLPIVAIGKIAREVH
jgi:hypothetical protein